MCGLRPMYFVRAPPNYFVRAPPNYFVRAPPNYFVRAPPNYFVRAPPNYFVRAPPNFDCAGSAHPSLRCGSSRMAPVRSYVQVRVAAGVVCGGRVSGEWSFGSDRRRSLCDWIGSVLPRFLAPGTVVEWTSGPSPSESFRRSFGEVAGGGVRGSVRGVRVGGNSHVDTRSLAGNGGRSGWLSEGVFGAIVSFETIEGGWKLVEWRSQRLSDRAWATVPGWLQCRSGRGCRRVSR